MDKLIVILQKLSAVIMVQLSLSLGFFLRTALKNSPLAALSEKFVDMTGYLMILALGIFVLIEYFFWNKKDAAVKAYFAATSVIMFIQVFAYFMLSYKFEMIVIE